LLIVVCPSIAGSVFFNQQSKISNQHFTATLQFFQAAFPTDTEKIGQGRLPAALRLRGDAYQTKN